MRRQPAAHADEGYVPDASAIADALVPEALRWAGPGPCRITGELVIPVTGERVDLCLLGTSTDVFEIKSGRDTLRRLPRQVDAFGRVADRGTLVAASRHVDRAMDLIPAWWGLIEVLDGPVARLRWRRMASPNVGTDRRTLLLLLRRDEAEAALVALDGQARPGVRRMRLLAELDRRFDGPGVAACVRRALLDRARDPGRSAIDVRHDSGPVGLTP